MQCVMRSRN